jgi:hypothetical protein
MAMTTPTTDGGKPAAGRQRGPVGRPLGVGLGLVQDGTALGDGQKVVAVSDGLADHEQAVQGERHHGGEGQLPTGELRDRPAGGERGQDQAERDQRRDRGQTGSRALGVEQGDAGPQRRDQERDADDARTGDDHRGEHRVPGHLRRGVTAGHHQRHDQGDLDHGDGHGQDQRAERLADPVRHDLRVVDGGEHRRAKDDRHQHRDHHGNITSEGRRQDEDAKHGREDGPIRPHPTVCCRSHVITLPYPPARGGVGVLVRPGQKLVGHLSI